MLNTLYKRAQLSVIATINQALRCCVGKFKLRVSKVESSSVKETSLLRCYSGFSLLPLYFSLYEELAVLDASDCDEKYKSSCRVPANSLGGN